MEKLCPKCGIEKPLTEEYFYKARPRKNHKKESWQSFCKACWKLINAQNKARRKNAGNQVQYSRWTEAGISLLQQAPSGIMCIVPKDFMPIPFEPAQSPDEVA